MKNDPKPRLLPMMGGPFSSFTAPPTLVTEQIKSDGLSRPKLAVTLRRWALAEENIVQLVLGHNGQNYTIAALLENPSFDSMRNVYINLHTLMTNLLGDCLFKIYTLGPDYKNLCVFKRYGNMTIHDRSTQSTV